jgi:hypothetical protein
MSEYFTMEETSDFEILIKNRKGQTFLTVFLEKNESTFNLLTRPRAQVVCDALNEAKLQGKFGLIKERN